MDDIFKSKDDMDREEKINNLFKSADSIEKLKEKNPAVVPEAEKIMAEEPEKSTSKVLASALLVLIFLGLAAAAGYFWWQYKKAAQNSATASASNESGIIVEKIKASMDLPAEAPMLATIASQDQPIDQPLFPNALEGDKILVYIQSKKAILYRPSSDQIVETASLISDKSAETGVETTATDIGAAGNAEKTSEKIDTKVKVDVLNGTEIKGLAKETADKLSGTENVELAKISNAQRSTYTKVLVVDVSGKNTAAAKIIAEILKGEVGTLPVGETKGTADILVIAGK